MFQTIKNEKLYYFSMKFRFNASWHPISCFLMKFKVLILAFNDFECILMLRGNPEYTERPMFISEHLCGGSATLA